jgi:hypothetical protein
MSGNTGHDPETQQKNAEVLPGSTDDAAMFYRNPESESRCIGYLRGDFGKSGDGFFNNWFDQSIDRKTQEFGSEFQSVMSVLRQGILEDYKTMASYCRKHPEAQLPKEEYRYGFKLETESRQYYIRCTLLREDYFYVFAYEKPFQDRAHEVITEPVETKRGYTSVIKAIEESKKAPKPPRKEKAQGIKEGDYGR